MSNYRDIASAPTELYKYFLVRPKGIHPRTGENYIPTVVCQIEGEFYTAVNECDPIYFGQNEADDHPLKVTLEWCPLPE